MVSELSEIQHFLSHYQPFSSLPQEVLAKISQNLEISYFRYPIFAAVLQFSNMGKRSTISTSSGAELLRRTGVTVISITSLIRVTYSVTSVCS